MAVRFLSTVFVGSISITALAAGCSAAPSSDPASPPVVEHLDTSAKSGGPDSSIDPSVDDGTSDAPPPGYVRDPGGYAHASCVHQVPTGSHINRDGDRVDENGKVLEHIEPCPYPRIRTHRTTTMVTGDSGSGIHVSDGGPGQGVVPTVTGYYEYTTQQVPSNATTWNLVQSTFTVPPNPSVIEGQTLFYFSGLVPSGSPPDQILQPVVQWGNSAAGGGNYWGLASWQQWMNGNDYNTPLLAVNSGDTIFMQVYLNAYNASKCVSECMPGLACSSSVCQQRYGGICRFVTCKPDYTWGIVGRLNRTNQVMGLWADTSEPMTAAYASTLEVWNYNSCNDQPHYADFSGIVLNANVNAAPTVRSNVPFAPQEWAATNPAGCNQNVWDYYGTDIVLY